MKKQKQVHIKQLLKCQRPREKLTELGPSNVSDVELLAIVLGQGTAGCHVLQLAEQVAPLVHATTPVQPAQLQKLAGVGPTQSLKILAVQELCRRASQPRAHLALSTPELVAREVRSLFSQKKEQVVALYCNARHELLEQRVLAIGNLNTVLLEPRDVFGPALTLPAAGLFIVHNHPSGNPQPSNDDIVFTQKVASVGQLLGVALLDHIILGDNNWSSLRQLGLLDGNEL